MAYTKSDMLYSYSWTAIKGDNPKVSGEPDSTLLSRSEGYEMLYFINKCADKWNWTDDNKASRRKLEKLIKTIVPGNIHSQRGIKEWVENNYKMYWEGL